MNILVAAFALMIFSVSTWGVINPHGLVGTIRAMMGPGFMFIAVGTRVALAILLWFAADSARHPAVFKVLAIIAIVAAVIIIAVGESRILKFVEWWAQSGIIIQRCALLLGVLFGAYLFWEIWPTLVVAA